MKLITSNVPAFKDWADWDDVADITGDGIGTGLFINTTVWGKNRKKSVFNLDPTGFKLYDGTNKYYVIADLAFALYHEFYHVNTNARKHGIEPVGGIEKIT